jgi:type I restriction enzyme S subunit
MLHVSAEDIESGMGRLAELHTAAEDGMTSPKYLFEPGDVLYSKLRPYLRKAVLADFQGVCSADMYPVSCNPSMLDARYLVWVLLSEEFTRYADAESRRARMPKLNREQLLSWQAPVPPIGVQKQVAARLHEQIAGAVQLQEAAQLQAQYIAGFPAALLRRAFRGEL